MGNRVKIPKPMSLIEFSDNFNNEEKCRQDLWLKRLAIGFKCPRCENTVGYKLNKTLKWECANCKHQISLIANTVFDNTKIELRKWYFAAYLILSSKGGMSAKELERHIGVTYKTAWYVNRRLREAMGTANNKYKLNGTVTMDEAYFTGRINDNETPLKRGRGTYKSKVIVAVSLTEDGKPLYVHMQVVENFKAVTIEKFTNEHIEKGSKIIADGFKSYKSIKLKENYFVDFDMLPADNAKSQLRWLHILISNAKAFILGTFHGLKNQDLQLYLNEFCYRFNRRYMPHLMFDKLIDSAIITPSIGYYFSDFTN